MAIIDRIPENTNYLQSNKFTVTFSRIPNVQYFCQTITIPGLDLGVAEFPTPFVDLPIAGDKIQYETLQLDFLVDEDLRGWREIHDWIRGLGFPTNFQEYKNLRRKAYESDKAEFPQYSDIIATINTSKNNPNLRFKFQYAFPISLSGIELSAQNSPETVLTAQATFRYAYFDIDSI